MGVTDCHVHINPYWEMREDALALLGTRDPEVARYVREPKAFLEYLDRCGVDRAVLVNYVAPEVIGYTEATNKFASDFAATDRRRLLPTGGIHANHPDPATEIRHLVHDLGIRALKLHPPHQLFRPNAYVDGGPSRLRELYGACEREHLPVIFHTGTSVFPRARNRFGDPILVEDVALDFPKLPIVLAHGGRPLWMPTAVFLTRRCPNVWLDVSGVPPARLLEYFPTLAKLVDKVVFGTDWPGPGVKDIQTNLAAFRALPLTPEVQRQILETNPLTLFPAKGPP